MEENQVSVKLNDVEWRQRSEALAQEELNLISQRAELRSEAEDRKERKKHLLGVIEATEGKVRILAREVYNREALVDAQQTLPGAEPEAPPEPEVPAPEPEN